jgi:Flp pilus assembly protein protease CpaA
VISRFGVSVAVAASVSAGFLWSAQESPLPATVWAAAFLFLAVEHDVRSMRIPNWLTGGGLAAALALAGVTRGMSGSPRRSWVRARRSRCCSFRSWCAGWAQVT